MKKMIVTISLIALLFLIFFGYKVYIGNTAAELFEAGYEKLENKDYTGAIEEFNRSLDLAKQGSWMFADEKVKKGLAVNYGQRGWCYMQLGQYEKALEDYNKAEELGQNNAGLYSSRGWTKNHLEQYEDAMIDFNKAIDMESFDGIYETYNGLGNSYRMLEENEEAIKYYDKAIKLNSTYSLAYMGRGFSNNSLENYKEAIKDFTKAIDLELPYSFAYYGRGIAYKNLNEAEKAKADFEKAVGFDTANSDELIAFKGLSLHELGKYEEAIADFNKAYKLKGHSWLLKCLGDSYKELEQNDKAAEYYKKYLDLAGNKYHDEDEVKDSLKEMGY